MSLKHRSQLNSHFVQLLVMACALQCLISSKALSLGFDCLFSNADQKKLGLFILPGLNAPSAYVCDQYAYFSLEQELPKLVHYIAKQQGISEEDQKKLSDRIRIISEILLAEVLSLEILQINLLKDTKLSDQLLLETFIDGLQKNLAERNLQLPPIAKSPEVIRAREFESQQRIKNSDTSTYRKKNTEKTLGRDIEERLIRESTHSSLTRIHYYDGVEPLLNPADVYYYSLRFRDVLPNDAELLSYLFRELEKFQYLISFSAYIKVVDATKVNLEAALKFAHFLTRYFNTTKYGSRFGPQVEQISTTKQPVPTMETAEQAEMPQPQSVPTPKLVTQEVPPKSSRAVILEWLAEKGTAGEVALEFIHADWLKYLSKNTRPVILLFGNQEQVPSEKDKTSVAHLARNLAGRGRRIIFDADSLFAETISAAAGAAAIGITGQKAYPYKLRPETYLIYLENVFLRMERLHDFDVSSIYSDSTSITGAAALIKRKVDRLVIVGEPKAHPSAAAFSGIDVYRGYESLNYELHGTRGSVANDSFSFSDRFNVPPNLEKLISEGQFDSREIVRNVEEILTHREKSRISVSKPEAVIFGSGTDAPQHEELTKSIVKLIVREGWGIVTGGAGGLMRTANEAAFTAGGLSVGIPVDPASSGFIRGEDKIPKHVHTSTILTKGYFSRIPLLLDEGRRPLACILYGNNGTKREVAATFMSMASNPSSPTEIALVSARANSELLDQLSVLHLPSGFDSRLHIIEDSRQLATLISKIKSRELKTSTCENSVDKP